MDSVYKGTTQKKSFGSLKFIFYQMTVVADIQSSTICDYCICGRLALVRATTNNT